MDVLPSWEEHEQCCAQEENHPSLPSPKESMNIVWMYPGKVNL